MLAHRHVLVSPCDSMPSERVNLHWISLASTGFWVVVGRGRKWGGGIPEWGGGGGTAQRWAGSK